MTEHLNDLTCWYTLSSETEAVVSLSMLWSYFDWIQTWLTYECGLKRKQKNLDCNCATPTSPECIILCFYNYIIHIYLDSWYQVKSFIFFLWDINLLAVLSLFVAEFLIVFGIIVSIKNHPRRVFITHAALVTQIQSIKQLSQRKMIFKKDCFHFEWVELNRTN